MSQRSHHGCARCKRRRNKCDEGRPSCLRCVNAGAHCEYLITLKWNGRTPRVPSQSNRSRRSFPAPPITLDTTTQLEPPQDWDTVGCNATWRPLELTRSPDPWTDTPPPGQSLLHHFINHASSIIGHRYVRDQTCRELIPLAFEKPSLRFAVMALAALHRTALLSDVVQNSVPDPFVSQLITDSLRHLRMDLNNPSRGSAEVILKTIKTLCTCEIYTGKADSSWRVHVVGAKALIDSTHAAGQGSRSEDRLTSQWYQSVEALAALTTRGPSSSEDDMSETGIVEVDCLFDLYTGYSPDLNQAFKRIGRAAQKRARLTTEPGYCDEVEAEATFLEQSVYRMIARDMNGLRFPPDIQLEPDEARQFTACNTAYQYSALIHIYRRIRLLDSRSEHVQLCVRTILDTICGIVPTQQLSPWALLTTPIFTAG